MKLYKEHGIWYLDLTKKCFITLINDWSQFWGKWNWITAHILQVYFENEPMTGGWEFEFIVLGLGFRFRYNYAFEESEAGQAIKEYEEEKKKEEKKKEEFKLSTMESPMPYLLERIIADKYKADLKKMANFLKKSKEFKQIAGEWLVEVRPSVRIRSKE